MFAKQLVVCLAGRGRRKENCRYRLARAAHVRRRFVPGNQRNGVETLEPKVLLSGSVEVTSETGGSTTVGSLPWAVANAAANTEIYFGPGITQCTVTAGMTIPAQNVMINGQGAGPNGGNEVIDAQFTGAVFTAGLGSWFQGIEIENAVNGAGSAAIVFAGTTYGTIEQDSFFRNFGGSVAIVGADDNVNMFDNTFTSDQSCPNGDVYDGDTDGGSINITSFTVTGDSGTSNSGASFFGANATSAANITVQEGSVTNDNTGFAIKLNVASNSFVSQASFNLIDFLNDDGAFYDTSSAGAYNSSRVTFAGDDVDNSNNSLGSVVIAASGTTTVGADNIYSSAYAAIVINGAAASQVGANIWQDAIHNINSSGNGGAIVVNTNSDTQVQVVDCTINTNRAVNGAGIYWTPLSAGQTENLILLSNDILYNTATTTGGGVDVSASNGSVVYSGNNIYAFDSAPTGPDGYGIFQSNYDLWDNTSGASISGTNDTFGNPDLSSTTEVLPGAPGDNMGTLPLGSSYLPLSTSPVMVSGDPSLGQSNQFPEAYDMNDLSRASTAVIGAVITDVVKRGKGNNSSSSSQSAAVVSSGRTNNSVLTDSVLGALDLTSLFPTGSSTRKSSILD